MEKINHILQSVLGLSFQHFLFIILGAGIHILDKYDEQNLKNKATKNGVSLGFWGEYMFTPETMISFIVTLVLAIFATGLLVEQLPSRPFFTAVCGGIAAFGGASTLRSQMKKYQYSKEIKAQNANTGGKDDI